jgi:hypothetical protein
MERIWETGRGTGPGWEIRKNMVKRDREYKEKRQRTKKRELQQVLNLPPYFLGFLFNSPVLKQIFSCHSGRIILKRVGNTAQEYRGSCRGYFTPVKILSGLCKQISLLAIGYFQHQKEMVQICPRIWLTFFYSAFFLNWPKDIYTYSVYVYNNY